jgi:hypothetical protein
MLTGCFKVTPRYLHVVSQLGISTFDTYINDGQEDLKLCISIEILYLPISISIWDISDLIDVIT